MSKQCHPTLKPLLQSKDLMAPKKVKTVGAVIKEALLWFPFPALCFPDFQLVMVNPRNKQFVKFYLKVILKWKSNK